jgi:hypothetical protein
MACAVRFSLRAMLGTFIPASSISRSLSSSAAVQRRPAGRGPFIYLSPLEVPLICRRADPDPGRAALAAALNPDRLAHVVAHGEPNAFRFPIHCY